jgi:hypothetical protein
MFVIDKDTKQINLTRGDVAAILLDSIIDDKPYTFKVGDVVRFKVFRAKDCNCVEMQKDTIVDKESSTVNISLSGEDTKIGELINKPTKFWYEIELNPDTNPQTIVGYDLEGEKIFMLYPEGDDK